ncbi:MAG: hypothetical protein D6719_00950 [Candidatus Dadabacteria bacterium]|nr:MAG: hypothetical protein D6719_00950 [Candidatus Dadabacteria bacterium]
MCPDTLNLSRYTRQTILPQIGKEGQKRLLNSRVLCVGAGGLGCPAGQYLVAVGVGELHLIDDDLVSESNLQRQILFSADDIGKSKAETAAKKLKSLNPEVKVKGMHARLRAREAVELFKEYDLIIDGVDNFSSKFLINDAAVLSGRPYVYGSIFKFEGQVSVFNYRGGPCYRCLYREPPKSYVPNCAEAGVLGSVAGICGTIQATEAIKVLLGNEKLAVLESKLLVFDAANLSARLLTVKRDPECPVCSDRATIKEPFEYAEKCNAENINLDEITADQLQAFPDAANLMLLDVRESWEFRRGHLKGAVNIPARDLLSGKIPVDKFSGKERILIYCSTGERSRRVAVELTRRYPGRISHLKGGLESFDSTLVLEG